MTTTQPTPEAAQREQIAKALYDHERAEEAKDNHVEAILSHSRDRKSR